MRSSRESKKYEREMQELQREQMELMKKRTAGGCLPLLLQMPIFWLSCFLTISLDVAMRRDGDSRPFVG